MVTRVQLTRFETYNFTDTDHDISHVNKCKAVFSYYVLYNCNTMKYIL